MFAGADRQEWHTQMVKHGPDVHHKHWESLLKHKILSSILQRVWGQAVWIFRHMILPFGSQILMVNPWEQWRKSSEPAQTPNSTHIITSIFRGVLFCKNPSLTCILEQCFILSSWGMVLVTTTASKHALLMREMAGPEKIPWVRIA